VVESDRASNSSCIHSVDAKTADVQCENDIVEAVVNNGQKRRKWKVTFDDSTSTKELIIPEVVNNCSCVTERSDLSNLKIHFPDDDQMVYKNENLNLSEALKQKFYGKSTSKTHKFEVILDSGATAHMFPSLIVFKTYEESSNQCRSVTLGDSKVSIPIVGEGTVEFLGKVLYVPQLKFGLISISQLQAEKELVTTFDKSAIVKDCQNITILEGYLYQNLYYLKDFYFKKMLVKSKEHSNIMANSTNESEVNELDKRLYNIHHKLGHMSVSKLRLALKDGLISGINMTEEELKKSKLPFCYDCMRGSMKANAKGHTTEHSWKLFEKVAVDYKGPFSVKSHSGFTGFYLFSDYFSDYVWVYLVKRKDQFLEALTQFHQFHNVKLNIQMQMLQGDYDVMHKDSGVKEFLSMNKGIQLQLSAPYTHST
jgi:hypothetical protein